MTTGMKIPPCQNVFSMQNLQKLITADLTNRLIDLQDNVLVVALFCLVEGHEMSPGDTRQFGLIAFVIAVVDRYEVFEAFQSGQSHCCRDLIHLTVDSDLAGLILTDKAEILHCARFGCQDIVVRNNRSAFESIEELGGMETKYLKAAEVADH